MAYEAFYLFILLKNMHIVICSSIDFTFTIGEVAQKLSELGHTVEIPLTSKKIIEGELTLGEYLAEKSDAGESAKRKIKDDVIKAYFNKISNADAILVLNLTKKGIPNYIGGNTFLEMGFAHVLNKHIFVYNDVPKLSYTDELLAFEPVVIHEDLTLIPNF